MRVTNDEGDDNEQGRRHQNHKSHDDEGITPIASCDHEARSSDRSMAHTRVRNVNEVGMRGSEERRG